MQIKDRDFLDNAEWNPVDEPLAHRLNLGFSRGRGFVPSSIDEGEELIGSIDFVPEPEDLEEKDRVGEDTRPRK